MIPHLYVIRAAPLSGKSTLAPLFCDLLPDPVACIRHDMLRWDIHRMSRHFTEVSPDEHRFAYENLTLLLERYLKHGGYNIVVEGLFTWDDTNSDQGDVKSLIELADQCGVWSTSFVLRADKDILLQRNADRTQQVPTEEFNTLYENVYKSIGSSEIVIDTGAVSVADTLARLKTYIPSSSRV